MLEAARTKAVPRRPLPFGSDTLEIPVYFAKGTGADDPGFQRWKREHPDWFAAGHWTAARGPRQSKPPVPDGRQNGTKRLSLAEAAKLTTFGPGPLDPSTLSISDFHSIAAGARAEAARKSSYDTAVEDSVHDPARRARIAVEGVSATPQRLSPKNEQRMD